MAGQGGGGLALIPCLLAFWGLGTVENVAQDEKFTVPFAVFAIRHGRNVMRAEKFTVPFAVFAIRHGRKCDMGRKIYRAFSRFRD